MFVPLFLLFFFPSSSSYILTVHRGNAPEGSQKRIVLFWFSYNKTLIHFGAPDCEKEQVTPGGWYKDYLKLGTSGAVEGLFMYRNHLPKFSDINSDDLTHIIMWNMLKNIQEVNVFYFLFFIFYFYSNRFFRCTILSPKEPVHDK